MGSLFTAGLTNSVGSAAANSALAIDIPEKIGALLGLGAFTAVAAPAIKDSKRTTKVDSQEKAELQRVAAIQTKTSQKLSYLPAYEGEVLVKQNSKDTRWLDLIQGNYMGSPFVDVSKLQQLCFSVLLLAMYTDALWATMNSKDPVLAFPPIDGGFLALLAISHAAYFADKQLATT